MADVRERLEKVTEALLVMQCAKCKIGNEVTIPIGEQRVFAVQCHSCKKLNEITIDTENGPLVLAEGKAEWNKHIKEVQVAAAAARGSGEDGEDGNDGEDGVEMVPVGGASAGDDAGDGAGDVEVGVRIEATVVRIC